MNKVFLGGTCNETTWRDELMPHLDVDYFNPVVDDWTEECQGIERIQKGSNCNIHLYVITCEMTGVFSIAEAIESAMTAGKVCIFHVIPEGFSRGQLKSLEAVCEMVRAHGGYAWVEPNILISADAINVNFGGLEGLGL